jgi:putative tricarboxylic transport membrane protein
VIFCAIGVYSITNNTFDVWIVSLFGILGYVFIKLDISPAPMVLRLILGRPIEENLRRTLVVANGDWSVLFTRPISAALLATAALLLIIVLSPSLRKVRDKAAAQS